MIDLRDQQENFSLAGRSRDGIRIRAEDVQVIYSLRRSSLDSTYQRPYPFREEAIRRLVYDQFFESGRQSWQVAIGEAIRGELWDFFIQHPLEEFLANTAGPEMRKEELDKNSIQEEGNRLAGLDELVYHANEKGRKAKFVARSQLSELFYGSNNSKAVQRMMQSGVDMHWIGVGTWILPAESISTRHEEAWRITKDNLIRGYPGALEGVQRSSYLAEMIRLVNETTISVYKDLIKEELSIKNLSSFISRYQTNLRQACEYLQQKILEQRKKEADSSRKEDEREQLQGEIQQLENDHKKIAIVTDYFSRLVEDYDTQKGKAKKTIKPSAAS